MYKNPSLTIQFPSASHQRQASTQLLVSEAVNMKFPTIIPLLMAATSALPTPQEQQATSTGVEAFNLMALRSASPIHFGSFSATRRGIYINLPPGKQDATCEGEDSNTATFYMKDGGLFLYHGYTTKPQQIFVDRSGMGKLSMCL
jgi:hypothetical protein